MSTPLVREEDPFEESNKKAVAKNVKRLKKHIKEKTNQVNRLVEQVQELQYARYQEIRRRNPEFKSFDDREITIYINLFDRNMQESFKPHSVILYSLGGLILCLDWFIFNAGSSLNTDPAVTGNDVGYTFGCTVMSASAGAVTAVLGRMFEAKYIDDEPLCKYDIVKTINGLMAACVGVTASSSEIYYFDAVIIGATSTLLYLIVSRIYARLHLDDPLEVSVIHGLCGFWGCICVGLFSKHSGLFVTGSFE